MSRLKKNWDFLSFLRKWGLKNAVFVSYPWRNLSFFQKIQKTSKRGVRICHFRELPMRSLEANWNFLSFLRNWGLKKAVFVSYLWEIKKFQVLLLHLPFPVACLWRVKNLLHKFWELPRQMAVHVLIDEE